MEGDGCRESVNMTWMCQKGSTSFLSMQPTDPASSTVPAYILDHTGLKIPSNPSPITRKSEVASFLEGDWDKRARKKVCCVLTLGHD